VRSDTFLSLPQSTNDSRGSGEGRIQSELPAPTCSSGFHELPSSTFDISPPGEIASIAPVDASAPPNRLGTVHDIQHEQMPELRLEAARNARNAAMRFAGLAVALLVAISTLAATAFIQEILRTSRTKHR
jgi:hypothetical protein